MKLHRRNGNLSATQHCLSPLAVVVLSIMMCISPGLYSQTPLAISGGGTGATTAGAARDNLQALGSISTAVQLHALPLTGLVNGDAVSLNGYYVPGDAPAVVYTLSTSPCSLNGGSGDLGSQIASKTVGNCWLLNPQKIYDPRTWGAVSSVNTGIVSTTAGSPTAILTTVGDWQNGQRVLIVGAGTSYSLGAPTLSSVAPSAAAGTNTYCYQIAAVDAAGGVGIASAETCSNTGPSQLGMAADLGVPNQGMNLTLSMPAGAKALVIYESSSPGAENFRAVFDGSSNVWTDYGHSPTNPATAQSRPSWIPNTPLTTAQNDWQQTSIGTGAGTTTISLFPSAINSAPSALILHDSTLAFTYLAATGQSLHVPCGTFNIAQTLLLNAGGQTLSGGGMSCSTLSGIGVQDIVQVGDGTTGNSGGGVEDISLDGSDEAAGNGISLTHQLRTNFNRIEIVDSYNCLALGSTLFSQWNVIRCSTDQRGQYTLHLYGTTQVNQTTFIHQLQNAISYTSTGIHVDGDVASFFLYDTAIQKTPYKQYLIDNAIGSDTNPSLLQTFNTGFNFCSDRCIDEEVGQQIKWIRTYAQSSRGAGVNVIYIAPGVKNTTITDSDVFGGDKACIEDHGFVTMISDSAVYACSSPANQFPAIEIGADAVGVTTSGLGAFSLAAAVPATSSTALINVEQGAQYVQIGPNWGATGQTCDVTDNQGSPNVTIEGMPLGSPVTTTLHTALGTTLTAATYTHLYDGVGGAIAKLCRSTGNANAFTDTLDSASNIISHWTSAGFVITDGFQFRIRIVSVANAIMTLAGGTGVTVTGVTTTPASGGGGRTVRHDFLCTVTSASTPTINCHG